MNFEYEKFRCILHGLRLGRPKDVLDLFLWTLTMKDGGMLYPNYSGRLFGIKWAVIGGPKFSVLFYLR